MQVIHVCGFGTNGIKASLVEGSLAEVANRTLDAIRSHGHDVRVATVRDLDGWLKEVHATVTVEPDQPMWHRFITPSEPWPMAPPDNKEKKDEPNRHPRGE